MSVMCEMSEEIHQRTEERAKRQERPQNTNELKGIKGILLRGITSAIFVFFHLGILYLGSFILVSYTCFLYDFFFFFHHGWTMVLLRSKNIF